MKTNLIIILFACSISIINAQKKFSLEFGLGGNYSSAILEQKVLEDTSDIQTQEIVGNYGYNFRLGIKYNLLSNLNLKSTINYTNFKYDYILIDYLTPDEPDRGIVDNGKTISKIYTNIIGSSIGLEYSLIKNISANFFLSYYKQFKRKSKTEINYFSSKSPHIEENIENWDNLSNEISSSFELSFNYKNFSLIPGIEYSFTKEKYFPTENTGNRYMYYTLLVYHLK